MDEDTRKFLRWRRFTLFAACFIPFGAQFAKQCISPLRPYFEREGTTANLFGLYLSAPSWPNLIQPLVITFFVDSKGHESGAILFSALALLGHALFAVSLSLQQMDHSTLLGVFGRILFGFGQGGSGIVQGAILGSHFESDLSFAIGLAQSVKNLSNWLGRLAPVALAEYFDSNYLVPIWFCCGLLFISCLLAVAHIMLEEVHKPFSFTLARPSAVEVPLAMEPSSPRGSVASSTYGLKSPHFSLDLEQKHTVIFQPQPIGGGGIWNFVRRAPFAFWAINVLHFLFSNTAGLFTGFSTSFYVEEYELSVQTAAFLSSLDALSPVLVAPIVGRFVDKRGGRLGMLAAFACCDVLCFLLFAQFRQVIPGGAWMPTILLSIAASAPSTLLKSCIPLVCEREDMALAFSVYFVFENIGHAIGQLVLGHLRTQTASFEMNLVFLCGVSVTAVLASLATRRWDQTHGGGLLSQPAAQAAATVAAARNQRLGGG